MCGYLGEIVSQLDLFVNIKLDEDFNWILVIDKIGDSLLKERDLGLGFVSRFDWSGVDIELRNMYLIGLIKTSGLYVYTFD